MTVIQYVLVLKRLLIFSSLVTVDMM